MNLSKIFNSPFFGASLAVVAAVATGLAVGDIGSIVSALAVLGESALAGVIVAGISLLGAATLRLGNFSVGMIWAIASKGQDSSRYDREPNTAEGFLKTTATAFAGSGLAYLMV